MKVLTFTELGFFEVKITKKPHFYALESIFYQAINKKVFDKIFEASKS
jgi:hypothetical protein